MQQPRVSVIVPVYNGERYLAQCLTSVITQTHRNVELIVVNDGSTDSCGEIIAHFADAITTLVNQPNSGSVGIARNAGLSRATGDYIAFLDQDDYWEPHKLKEQLSAMASNRRLGLVHTRVNYLDDATGVFVACPDPTSFPEHMTDDCYERLLHANPIVNSSVMVSRGAIDAVGFCDTDIRGNTVQDYDLWLRIARAGYHFSYCPQPLTVFRLHSTQGHRNRCEMLQEELKVLLRHRPLNEWKETATGRRRLLRLFDDLATAHFESRSPWYARYYFLQALATGGTARNLVRLTASCLPYPVSRRLRDFVQRSRKPRHIVT